MIHIVIDGERPFAVGAYSPEGMRRAAKSEVSMSPIRSDGRTDSEADSFSLSLTRADVDDLFWPLPLGAQLNAYRDGDADPIAAGTVVRIEFGATAISMAVQL